MIVSVDGRYYEALVVGVVCGMQDPLELDRWSAEWTLPVNIIQFEQLRLWLMGNEWHKITFSGRSGNAMLTKVEHLGPGDTQKFTLTWQGTGELK